MTIRISALLVVLILVLSFGSTAAHAATTSDLLPVADGTYTQWTPNANGIHYTRVDETTCNGNTDYNSETSVNQRDSYNISLASVPNGATITGITITPCASKNSNGGQISTVKVFYRLNGVNSAESQAYSLTNTTPSQLLSTNYTEISVIKEASTTLESGIIFTSGNKGARLSRIATVITYTPLFAPTSLSANAAPSSAINLSWIDNATNEGGYKVERSLDGASGWSEVGSVAANGTSFTDSGLFANKTYYYRVYAYNAGGNSGVSNSASATTDGAAPSVFTISAGNITSSSADLLSTVNANGSVTFAGFRYGPVNTSCPSLSGHTGYVSDGTSGHIAVENSMRALNLGANTTYYYCAEAYNSFGTSYGEVTSFTTQPSLPSVTTGTVTNITSSSVRMFANVNPKGSPTDLYFRYGTESGDCTSLPSVSPTQFVGADNTLYAGKSQDISELLPGTTYYYCAAAENAQGASYGSVLTFTTLGSAPSVQTDQATEVQGTGAVLNATVNPNGVDTTVSYRYTKTTLNIACNNLSTVTSGVMIGSGTGNISPIAQQLTGLIANSTYKFCVEAVNANGTTYGNVQSFTTPAIAPTVTTLGYNVTGSTTAWISGGVHPNNSPTIMRFRYGSENVGCSDLPQITPDNSIGTTVVLNRIQTLSGLTPATTYYYCVAAENAAGTSYGAVNSFTTNP